MFSKVIHLSWIKGFVADHRGPNSLNITDISCSYDTLISFEAEEQRVYFLRMITGRSQNDYYSEYLFLKELPVPSRHYSQHSITGQYLILQYWQRSH